MILHTYHDGIEVETAPIYAHDLATYKRDTANFKLRKMERKMWFKIAAFILAIASFPFFRKNEIGLLLTVGSLLALHPIYA